MSLLNHMQVVFFDSAYITSTFTCSKGSTHITRTQIVFSSDNAYITSTFTCSSGSTHITRTQVVFSSDNAYITSMHSMAGERVDLGKGVQVTDSIETWLSSLAR